MNETALSIGFDVLDSTKNKYTKRQLFMQKRVINPLLKEISYHPFKFNKLSHMGSKGHEKPQNI
jgi:hypothetical protein